MDAVLRNFFQDATIPELSRVIRHYPDDAVLDVTGAVRQSMDAARLEATLPKSGSIALAVGSRGICRLPEMVAAVAAWFRDKGFAPFIVPAMGSHGGATAQGQADTLAQLGVTERSVGCPVRSGMEVEEVGLLPEGIPVYMDALAARADGIFVINRVKPHTAFRGSHESGLVKMITIGLGKQKGAATCHASGFGAMPELMPRMAALALERARILGGLGIVENAHDHPLHIEAVNAGGLFACDSRLLDLARAQMPALPVRELDVLVLDEMGKNISGAGLDGAVTGRFATPYLTADIRVSKLVVLDLTPESEGNATGMGNADIITRRLHDSIDFSPTYANALTTTLFKSVMVPLVTDSDEDAMRCAIKTCNASPDALRLIRIRNTLTPTRMLVSPVLAEELRAHPQCEVLSGGLRPRFGSDGTLLDRDIWNDFDGVE
ncbi:lactate racemase domain-containing protein [uncultured Desulfovibrio sp.]|uniref:lactate racemase domain-containing protein n=1 Tax=uncultured Desulfovibrio sp. TaxID=167968 RepID=UPI00267160CA|nr:lactate racemase domain-containing protein [uncultured Desulfovibrio sp.]